MAAEHSGRGKLSEFVSDHVLRHENRHVLATVVDRKRVTDHIGKDRGSAAPSLDQPLLALLVQIEDLLHEMVVDKKSFL